MLKRNHPCYCHSSARAQKSSLRPSKRLVRKTTTRCAVMWFPEAFEKVIIIFCSSVVTRQTYVFLAFMEVVVFCRGSCFWCAPPLALLEVTASLNTYTLRSLCCCSFHCRRCTPVQATAVTMAIGTEKSYWSNKKVFIYMEKTDKSENWHQILWLDLIVFHIF